ncbi:MAG: flavodoxin [Bacteroidetes bacterium]|nr:flavodoxin [Bacteroidota bacterium]
MKQIGLFYGSTTGNTEQAAEKIRKALGEDQVVIFNVDSATTEDVQRFDNLIFGLSTWGVSDMQDDFEDFLEVLENVDFNGKKVALFGLGDSSTYPDTFVDGMGVLYQFLKKMKGITFVGACSTEGYTFDASLAKLGKTFVGLPLDEDYEAHLTAERIQKWVETLKKDFS